jgi:hypothetical protein
VSECWLYVDKGKVKKELKLHLTFSFHLASCCSSLHKRKLFMTLFCAWNMEASIIVIATTHY